MSEGREPGGAIVGLAWAIAIITVIGFVIYMLTGCAGEPVPLTRDVVVVQHVLDRCVRRPPPIAVPVPRPTVCIKGKVCWDTPDAANLYDDVAADLDWINDTWDLCRPLPETQPAP
jgi:hypothetical protein